MNTLCALSALKVRQVQHDYSLTASYGGYEVMVSPSTNIGWFQQVLGSRVGTLRFNNGVLTDVEGCDVLPRDVVEGLRLAGFRVPI